MARGMSVEEWVEFEALARAFCELRSEYRRRKEAGSLGRDLEHEMVQSLNALELEIERQKSGNEIARLRAAGKPFHPTLPRGSSNVMARVRTRRKTVPQVAQHAWRMAQ